MINTLLQYVNELGNKSFWRSNKSNDKTVGSSNIRNLAVLANNADCYEELRLFIEYKTAKGNGWNKKFDGDTLFGHKILQYLDEIYKKCNRDDRETLKNISKFFGYLYWKVCAIEKRGEN